MTPFPGCTERDYGRRSHRKASEIAPVSKSLRELFFLAYQSLEILSSWRLESACATQLISRLPSSCSSILGARDHRNMAWA